MPSKTEDSKIDPKEDINDIKHLLIESQRHRRVETGLAFFAVFISILALTSKK